jgi:hypothetical protein
MLAAIQLAFWVTDVNLFSGNRHFYPYRPNPYVDAYDDPKSRHWLLPDAPSSRRARRPVGVTRARRNLRGDGRPRFQLSDERRCVRGPG